MQPRILKSYAGGRVGFIGSFPSVGSMPAVPYPEIAFAGRSNVGKSSAINKLLNTRKVARVSNTPGRTQAINLFAVEKRVVFADLPGYGFARVPIEVKEQWKGLVEGYLGNRDGLRLVVVLVDSRHPPQSMDADLIWGLRQARLPILVLATKVDKLKRNARAKNLKVLRQGFGLKADAMIPFSSHDGTGVDTAWTVLERAIAGPLDA
jgi:GTP-binding protein